VLKEARALEIVASVDISTPPLVAVDTHGRTCDVPAILMEQLPGQVELNPPDRDAWVAGLAEPLALIHTLHSDLYREVPAYAPHNDVAMLTPPEWSRDPGMWSRVFHLLQGPRPGEKVVFLHRDYHPTNVLWYRGEVSGVLDWTNACRGPAGVDVGHCRLNLVQIFGLDMAAKFLNEYCAATGYQHHPYWDLLTAIDCLPLEEVYPGWRELGLRDLTIDMVRERVEAYVSAVLQRIW
jgi:aminoglycoside phosphotransferase (APT) family kinase protein